MSAVREKVSQAELLQLGALKVGIEIEHLLKIVRADLNRRFTHLECSFPDRVLPFFGDEHTNRRRLQVQLSRKAQARQAAAEDDDIVGWFDDRIHWAGILSHGRRSTKYRGLR